MTLSKENESRTSGDKVAIHWTPPPNCFKANWDVALCKERSRMGIEIIMRDFKGLVYAALRKTMEIYTEAAIAEAMGALRAMEFCKEIGLQEVLFEGDAEVVVKAINNKDSTWCRYGHIIEDIKLLLGYFRRREVIYAKREAKGAAHGLAKMVTREQIDKLWMEEIPSIVLDIVTLEQFALSV